MNINTNSFGLMKNEYFNHYFPDVLPTIHQNTNHLLARSKEIALSVMPKKEVWIDQPRERRRFPHFEFSPIYMESRPYHTYTRRDYDEQSNHDSKKDNFGWRVFVVAVGTIATVGGMYLLGKAQAERENCEDQSAPFFALENKWNAHRILYVSQSEFTQKVDEIAVKAFAIEKRKITDRTFKVAYMICLVSTGVLFVVGGVIGSSALSLSGLILGITGTALMLGYSGYMALSNKDEKDAYIIKKRIKDLEKMNRGLEAAEPVQEPIQQPRVEIVVEPKEEKRKFEVPVGPHYSIMRETLYPK